tara:strand:- start:14 stop:283 length:270 start_codon:yes stop_codon:yes gene_type:complete
MLSLGFLTLASVAPDVAYHGRWDTSGAVAVCGWPMSGFSVSTDGTTVSAKMAAGSTGASLVVLVDHKVHVNVTVAPGASTQGRGFLISR